MASAYTQTGKPLRVDTPLGADVLLLERFECREAVSEQSEMVLHLLSTDAAIDPKRLLRKPVTVTVDLAGGGERYFNGLVRRFVQLGKTESFVSYRAEVVPATWFLSLTTDCRIFQAKSVPDIVKEVLTQMGITEVRAPLKSYSPREYCVQYRETHLDFISRLLEEEGIFYFFEHAKYKHTLVMGDAPSAVKPGPLAKLSVNSAAGGAGADCITALEVDNGVVSGKVTLVDYNDTTTKRLESTVAVGGGGTVETLTQFDYPGKFAAIADGDRRVRVRLEEAESLSAVIVGATNYCGLASGQKLEIDEHYRKDVNQAYHVLSAHHSGVQGGYRSANDQPFGFETTFKAIPYAVPYRPPRVTPRSIVHGTQTAVVVGPAGEEIYTDKFGRVKVQFFWDRQGAKDEKSSCWVRVSSTWAGKKWGAISIPRIGQEVVVDFLEGDPDRPIVVGSVYNSEHMPAYELPANQSQSGVKTRSTLGGGPADYNELRFEDKQGSEVILFHAQKDSTIEVEHDETHSVGNDRKVTVENNETISVKKNREITIVEGNDVLKVSKGKLSTSVDMGNLETKLGTGNMETKLGMGSVTLKADTGKITYEAMQGIELKVGSSSIKIDQSGVTIKGIKVSLEAMAAAEIKGVMTSVKADGILTMKGSMTMIN